MNFLRQWGRPLELVFEHAHMRKKVVRLTFGQAGQFLLDLAALSFVFHVAYQLRFEFHLGDYPRYWQAMICQLPVVVAVQWFCMFFSRVYRRLWRFVSLVDLPPFCGAFAVSGALFLAFRTFVAVRLGWLWVIPYSVIVYDTTLALFAVLSLRVLRRIVFELLSRHHAYQMRHGHAVSRVVLLGAGMAGVMAARELARQGNAKQKIVGFLDDDPVKQNTVIAGVPVLGPVSMIRQLAEKRKVDEAVITVTNTSRENIARMVRSCEAAGIKPRIIPSLYDIIGGTVSIAAIRDVDIADLLGRDIVLLDSEAIRRYSAGKRILVTGAGGSIGSELVRQLIAFAPKTLYLLEQGEFALYEIHREMLARNTGVPLVPVIADIASPARMEEVFREFRPEVVIHAAAYKHVPMMETNVREAVTNNVFGTRNVAALAGKYGTEVFVMISTDKAVNPTSVMGTTKRIAELIVQEQDETWPNTRYVSVRFGNVLGSTGSVIPLFREQIRRGGPVTVTHPEMKRYFMTIPEASRLVLQAAAIGNGGEIFVLDMGEPVKIDKLARDMIRLSGLEPDKDIPIRYTGLRPGEKMFEELTTTGENATKTRHPKIFIGKIGKPDARFLHRGLKRLESAVQDANEAAIRAALSSLVPEATLSPAKDTAP